MPGPQAKLYLKKGLQYGDDGERHAVGLRRGRLGRAARDGEDHEPDPVRASSPRRPITAGFKTFKGPLVLGAPEIACGKVAPAQPAVCGNQTQFYKYLGKGKWKPASGWLKPPGVK